MQITCNSYLSSRQICTTHSFSGWSHVKPSHCQLFVCGAVGAISDHGIQASQKCSLHSSGNSKIKVMCVSKLVNKSEALLCWGYRPFGMPVRSSFDIMKKPPTHSSPEEEHLANLCWAPDTLKATANKKKKTRKNDPQIRDDSLTKRAGTTERKRKYPIQMCVLGMILNSVTKYCFHSNSGTF